MNPKKKPDAALADAVNGATPVLERLAREGVTDAAQDTPSTPDRTDASATPPPDLTPDHLASLLARVTVEDAPGQEDAATITVDRLTRTALVRVNPDLVDAQARHGYRLRGVARLILSGYAAYNRDIKRKYGEWPDEQNVHDLAADDAEYHLQALLHQLRPYQPDA